VRPALAGLAGLLLLAAGLPLAAGLTARYAAPVPPGAPRGAGTGVAPGVEGAFHVHTRRSDGRGTEAEVVAAARQAGLSFVVLSDHNAPPQPPRLREGVLVLDAVELSTPHGHLVALAPGGGPVAVAEARAAADPVAAVAGAGAFAVLAHPVQRKNPWRLWGPAAAAAGGFELYSADTLWRDALASPLSRLWPAALGWLGQGVHGVMALADDAAGPRERLLALTPPPVALCSHDAHGLPPYADVFRALSMHLPLERLPEEPAAAAEAVASALRGGEALCVFRALGPVPEGFLVGGLGPGRRARAGGRLSVALPPGALQQGGRVQLRAWGAGRVGEGGREVLLGGPGRLQLEVWREAPGRWGGREWRPWLVPSPIEVVP
jgi:hypothetical protein